MPPLNGGYIVITLDGEELHLVSAPSMVWGAGRHRDSVAENFDEFDDEHGNEFRISIYSSNVGVDWEIDITTEDDILKDHISVEYHANDY